MEARGTWPARVWGWKWRVLALVVVLGLTGVALYLNARQGQGKTVVVPEGPRPVVAEAGVVPGDERKLTFPVSGTLRDLPVKVGEKVKAGDVVARLDSAALELKVEDAQANLELQKATIAQESEPAAAGDLTAARAALDGALAKQRDVEAGALPADLKAAEDAVASAQGAVDNARAQYQKLLNGPTAADVAQAQASVRSAEAQLASAQQKLADVRAQPKPDDVKAAQLAVDQAKNALWAQQLSRDSTCGTFGANGAPCKSADANVAAQETAVQSAQASLDKAREPATSEQLTAADKGVQSAQTSLDSAKTQLAQVQGGAGQADRDAARAQVDQAAANLRSAQAKLDGLRAGSTRSDVVAAQSGVEQARDSLDKLTRAASPATVAVGQAKIQAADVAVREAQQALTDATLRAPIDGEVTSIGAKAGDAVGPGTVVLTIADLGSLEFQTKDLDEISAAKVHLGQSARVTIAALDKRTFIGTVTEISPEPSITTSGDVSYVVTVVPRQPPPELRWGQTGRVEFLTSDQ